MGQRVKRAERKRRQQDRRTATGAWRISCGPGQVVYRNDGEPMRFESEEDAELYMRECGWHKIGMAPVLLASNISFPVSGRTPST